MTSTPVPSSVPNTCRPPTAHRSRGPRILVFGCARSGTTLLVNLLRTFTDVMVRDGEHCATDLLDDPHPGWVAAKRTAHCAEHLLTDLPFLRADVWILDLIRDPRDVVTSTLPPFPGYYCGYERWDRDLRISEALTGRHLRYLRIRYEELLLHPDDLQHDLADILDLNPELPFSQFARIMPPTLPVSAVQALGGIRPLDPRGVGRWPRHLARVQNQLAEHPHMEDTLQWMGYPPTTNPTRQEGPR